MIDNVLNGYGTPAYSVCDGMPWYSSAAMEVAYDPEGAAELLERRPAGRLGGRRHPARRTACAPPSPATTRAGDSVRQAHGQRVREPDGAPGRRSAAPSARGGPPTRAASTPHQYTDPVLWGWGVEQPRARLYMPALRRRRRATTPATTSAAGGRATSTRPWPPPRWRSPIPNWQAAQWDDWNGFAPQGGAPPGCGSRNVDHLYFKRRTGWWWRRQKPHPARPRLVAGEQRRPVDVGLMFRRRGGVRIAPSRSKQS